MKHRIRLQGDEFRQMKPNLTLMLNKTKVSNNGNICFVMRDRAGQEYTHWLNDVEKEQFKAKYDVNKFINSANRNKSREV